MKADCIVLPGGAGLVGQNLVAQLKGQGYCNIVVIDKHVANLAILRQMHPDIIAEYADLAEPGEWGKLLAGANAVVMLQAQIGGNVWDEFQRNNVNSTFQVLNAMKENNVKYLIHVSSSVVESVANDWYTTTKKEQERLVLESGINHIVLRPTLMFGWFDRKHLGWLSRFMLRTPVFPIPGHGRYMRQPLYAGDFCNIIASCIEKQYTGIFNITGLEKIDYIDIIHYIKIAVQSRAMMICIPYWLFHLLLSLWAFFDSNPPFSTRQLSALVAHDEFEMIDWPFLFGVTPTPFVKAINLTYNDPSYAHIVLDF